MVFLRQRARTVVDLPLTLIAVFVLFSVAIATQISSLLARKGGVWMLVLDAFFLSAILMQVRITSRVGDELVLHGRIRRRRVLAREYALRGTVLFTRAMASGPRTLQLELVSRHGRRDEVGPTIAVVTGGPRGIEQADAIATVLDVPRFGDCVRNTASR